MKKLLSASLAIVLLSISVLPALASEEYVYPPTQAAAENHVKNFLMCKYESNRVTAVTGVTLYFSGEVERINLYELSEIQIFRNGVPVEEVELKPWVEAYKDYHAASSLTMFWIHFAQPYSEPGLFQLRYRFQNQPFETEYILIEGPPGEKPADKDALKSINYLFPNHRSSSHELYEVYNICSAVGGLAFTFEGQQDIFRTDDLQDLTYTRNGVPSVVTQFDVTQRFCWPSYNYVGSPTEKDIVTVFKVDIGKEFTEPGVYTTSGRYQDVEFQLDDILILTPEQTESLLHAHKWAHEKLAFATARGLVPEDMPPRFQENITRAEFCRLAVRYIEAKTQMGIDDYLSQSKGLRNISFSDTGDKSVLAMARLGIVSGTGNGQFQPEGRITRQEAAQIVANLQRHMDGDITQAPRVIYKDSDQIAPWASSAVDYTFLIGALEGDGVYFRPLDSITYEESVIVWENLYCYANWQGR